MQLHIQAQIRCGSEERKEKQEKETLGRGIRNCPAQLRGREQDEKRTDGEEQARPEGEIPPQGDAVYENGADIERVGPEDPVPLKCGKKFRRHCGSLLTCIVLQC